MIYICKNEKLNKFLEKYIRDFINKHGDKLIGIDFEFNRIENKRQIALCQINFVINNESDIFLFYPPNISKELFEELLINEDIIKVIHGGESLDIPYLFENIIEKDNRREFCLKLFDTRYLCEYEKLSSCKIYELLLIKKVISKKKYNELMENDKLMGNIWDINIDVKKLSKELALYSVYDVKFLPKLYYKFVKSNNNIYTNYIQEIACVVLTLRYENLLDPLFTNISKHNLEKINNKTLIDHYKDHIDEILSDTIINNIYSINYFKKFMEILFKNIIYNKLNNNIKLFDFNIDSKIIKRIENTISI